MKERPIIFSEPMVRAILDGRKTQTRRNIKPLIAYRLGLLSPEVKSARCSTDELIVSCPYGQPGDRLWVREAWQIADWTDCGDPCIRYTADQAERWPDLPMEAADWAQNQWAALSDPGNLAIDGRAADRRRRHGMFMPRWASRITLEITDVRVERLQDISEKDAVAEGMEQGEGKWHSLGNGEAIFRDKYGWFAPDKCTRHNTPRHAFREFWNELNGANSWNANPWVWVISFKRLDQREGK